MQLDEIASRTDIADLQARYCRAVDRCDLDLLKSLFWDDATVQYGIFDGPAAHFAELTVSTVRTACQATMHTISNSLVKVEGDVARSETYVTAYHSMSSIESIGDLRYDPAMGDTLHDKRATTAGRCSFTVGARYLDRCSRRDGRWRIVQRCYVWDWCNLGPPNLLFDASSTKSQLPTGRRNASDLSYSILGTHRS